MSMATSFFYIYVMAISLFYIYVMLLLSSTFDIYIDIYKLTEHPVVLLNAIFFIKWMLTSIIFRVEY